MCMEFMGRQIRENICTLEYITYPKMYDLMGIHIGAENKKERKQREGG